MNRREQYPASGVQSPESKVLRLTDREPQATDPGSRTLDQGPWTADLGPRILVRWILIIAVLVAGQLVVGCSLARGPGQALVDMAQRVLATPTVARLASSAPTAMTPVTAPALTVSTTRTPEPVSTPAARTTPVAGTTPVTGTTVITLTLWTTEALAPDARPPGAAGVPPGAGTPAASPGGDKTPAGQLLAEQIQAFTKANPGVVVRHVLKQPYGRAGILQFLRVTKKAVPSALPDLVVLDTVEVAEAANDELLQPLDPLLSRELANDLFPFAQQVGRVGGKWVAVQFEADLEHLVYNLNKVSEAPLTWTDVLSGTTTYLFPAAGLDGRVNTAFLVQYLALGGRLADESGRPTLSREEVTQVLSFYSQGHELGVIPERALRLHTPAECWPFYLSAEVGMTNVTASQFLVDRAQLRRSQFAGIPTRDGVPATLASGWAYAITTEDPRRMALAARLIEWLMAPENLGAWSQAAQRLPTRRAALDVWPDDDYRQFLRDSLEGAYYLPPVVGYDRLARALQRAVEEVLTGAATPEDAAARATQSGPES